MSVPAVRLDRNSPPGSPATPPVLQAGRFRLVLDRVHLMGIVNVTPDSFADAGRHADAAAAIAHAEALRREGADLLDIGGESTHPDAPAVDEAEEWRRVEPVLRAALTLGVPVSVDTRRPAVMRRALALGADMINDVQALQAPGALQALAAHPTAAACLMHMRGEPSTMRTLAHYDDVTAEVAAFLRERLDAARQAGVADERLLLDPGYGFAKTPAQTLTLLAQQRQLLALGRPLLAGLSRKGTLGVVTGRPVGQRLPASLAAALIAAQQGAAVLRVHDVAATVDVLKVWQAVRDQGLPG